MRFSRTFIFKILLLAVLTVFAFFAGVMVQRLLTAGTEISEIIVEPEQPSRAEIVMKALSAAYPDRIGPAEFRDEDWAFLMGGKWYYYTEGRILPDELRSQYTEYGAMRIYNYPAELPPLNPEQPQMRNMNRDTSNPAAGQRARPAPGRSQYFFEELWRIHSRDEAWERMKQINFLGFPVIVHYGILKELSLVEERILKEAKTNPAVQQWINTLGTVDAWSWRNVANSSSRSYHSYGIAIDLLPKNLNGLETYWQWTAQRNIDWRTVPYSKRYHPPDGVIRAFESFGFIWGGKWPYYDTMHFEYRPDAFILGSIPLADLRTELP
jgi:hypothetical protein